ncbi:hypothetical protein [Roseateles sp. P5_D6]
MNYELIRALCPVDAGAGYDWTACCEVFPRLRALETTPQSPRYHAEGNVGSYLGWFRALDRSAQTHRQPAPFLALAVGA